MIPCSPRERDVTRRAANSFPSPEFLAWTRLVGQGRRGPPSSKLFATFHFPPLLPSPPQSVRPPHLNLQSELIVPHRCLTHPLTPSNPEPVMEGVSSGGPADRKKGAEYEWMREKTPIPG